MAIMPPRKDEDDDISRRAFNAEPTDLSVTGGRGLVYDADRKGDWMQTYTGKRFYPRDPRTEDVDILDIALALGNISRYLGHCRFYSVAEHSVMVSRIVPPHLALEGLLHDAEEAYAHDLIRPWKRALPPDNEYFKLASKINRVVRRAFGLPEVESREVKEADVAVLKVEKEVLHPRSDPWHTPFPDPGLKIRGLLPPASSHYFLRRYIELTGIDGGRLLSEFYDILQGDDVLLYKHWGV